MPRRASATRLVYVTVITDPGRDTKWAGAEAASKPEQGQEAEKHQVSQQANEMEGRKNEREKLKDKSDEFIKVGNHEEVYEEISWC